MHWTQLFFLFSTFQCAKASNGLQNEWWFWVIICLCILGISACAVEYLLSPGNYHQNDEDVGGMKIELTTTQPTPKAKKKKKRKKHEHRKKYYTPPEDRTQRLPKAPKPPQKHRRHVRHDSDVTETTVSLYEPPRRRHQQLYPKTNRPMYYDYHPTYSYNFYGGAPYPQMIPGTKGFPGMPPHAMPPFVPPQAKFGGARIPRDARDNLGKRGPQFGPTHRPNPMFPPYMPNFYPPQQNYPPYRPPHQRETSNYGSVRSGHSSHFSVSRAHHHNMDSSVGVQDQPTRVNKKLVDIDERHPVPDNRKYRKKGDPREFAKKADPRDFAESSEDVAEIIPSNFHPAHMHISPTDLRVGLHEAPLKSASPVTSPVARAFETTNLDDDDLLKHLSYNTIDDDKKFQKLTSGFRKSPAIIEKQIEAARSMYGYGIKADKQVMKYLMNSLNLKNMKYAETLLRMYDNNTLHHIEAPHHPAPSKPLPGHRRHLTSGSLSDELLNIDEEFLSGENFRLHSESTSSGSHDPRKWHEDPKVVASSWKKDSVVEVFDKAEKQWIPAVVIDEFDYQGDKWLGLDFAVHGDEHIYKEVKRFSEDVRSLGVSQLEKESDIAEADPNHELLLMHGLLKDPRRSEGDQPFVQNEITVSAHGAGSEIVNGRYIWQHEGCYKHKLHRNIELQHDTENHLWMFTCTSDHHNYYFAMGNDGSDVPPVNGYNVIDGKMNPPTLEIFLTEEHESLEIESSSESDSEFIINNDFMELTFKLKAENVDALGVEWSHTPNEKHLILWNVPAGSRGDGLGLRSQDILHTISGEHKPNSYDMYEVLETEEFPMTCTVLRHRTVMAVVTIESCGVEELCGRYTIAGNLNDELLFVNNDNPEYQIFSGDHHNWIIGSFKGDEMKEYYMVNIDEEIPPTSHWRVCEHGKKPKPKIINTEEHLDIPTPPRITRVIPGDGQATIEFEFDQSTLVPESAPRMKWWYRVEGRHCSQIGYDKRITITGLKNGEEYQFVVKAESQVIRTVSKLSEVVVPLKTPKAEWRHEANHYGIRGGDQMCTVYFNDSGKQQNNMRSDYLIEIEGDRYPLEMSPHVVSDLYNGHEYKMQIIAQNAVGEAKSPPLSITPLLTPHEPSITFLEEGEDSVLVHYQCHRYKDREIDASIIVRTDPESPVMEPTKKRPIEVTNLVTGIPYRIQLVALNTTGITEGKWYSQSFTPMWRPAKPQIVQLTPGHGTIGVFWECDYQCTDEFRPDFIVRTIPPTAELEVPAGIQAVELTGLTCGVGYQIVIEAMNANGVSESEPSKTVIPLENPPKPHSLEVTKKKQFLKLKWECEDVTDPKYNAEFVVWSEPSIGHLVHTSRMQHNFTNLIDGVDYHFYVRSANGVGESQSAVSGPISLHHKHLIIGHGRFGIEEMAEHLDDTRVLTALFSLAISDIHLVLRFQFVGKYASPEMHAEAKLKHDRITDILGEYDGEIQSFESANDVTIKAIINLCRASLSEDPKLASLTLEKIVHAYHDDMFERKIHYRKSQSRKSTSSHGDASDVGEDLERKRVNEIIEKCRSDDDFVNWVCFSLPNSELQLTSSNGFGPGSIPQLGEYLSRQQLSQALCLVNVLGSNYLIHFCTPEAATDSNMVDELAKQLRPYVKMLAFTGSLEDVDFQTVLSALQIDANQFFSSLQNHLERFPPLTRRLKADKLIRDKLSQENLSRIIEQVKDQSEYLNWVLIDPADC